MTTEPYASARRVFWVVDNGSSHERRSARSTGCSAAWPTADLVHLPIHASWLNQVEIYFSILQRKAINPRRLRRPRRPRRPAAAFEDHYNATAAALRLELHPHRPSTGSSNASPPRAAGGMTPDVPMKVTTSVLAHVPPRQDRLHARPGDRHRERRRASSRRAWTSPG